jgi:hypothetical protein
MNTVYKSAAEAMVAAYELAKLSGNVYGGIQCLISGE